MNLADPVGMVERVQLALVLAAGLMILIAALAAWRHTR